MVLCPQDYFTKINRSVRRLIAGPIVFAITDSIAITGHYRVVISMPGCAAKAYANYPLKIKPRDSCVCLRDFEGRFHSCIRASYDRYYVRQILKIQSLNILCIYIFTSYFYSQMQNIWSHINVLKFIIRIIYLIRIVYLILFALFL